MATTAPAEIAETIPMVHKAYAKIVDRSGIVSLARLRKELSKVTDQYTITDTLRWLDRHDPDVTLMPSSNTKGLTKADRAAAIDTGHGTCHLIICTGK